MKRSIQIDNCCGKDIFCITFHNSVVRVLIDDLLHILMDLAQQDQSMLELSLQLSLQPEIAFAYSSKPSYKLMFGRTILLFSDRELLEFMSQMWQKNPMLMHWALSQKQECS